ncbi:MAG: CHAP domain-containing protein [Oscillospiraceae bacterium]|nr:CHAP domain-containing protein [Candidatus Ruminococcus equi]
MATSLSKILNIARAEIGTKATNYKNCKYNTWYYGTTVSGSSYDWCEVFIQWIFKEAGASDMLYSKTANCGAQGKAFKNKDRLVTSNYQVGDIVFFHWSNDKSTYVPSVYTMDHVGIIESVNSDGTITTIEGNNTTNTSNGEVRRQTRSKSYISCAGRPDYSDVSDSTYPDVYYKVRTNASWLPEVKNLEDYAGIVGSDITDVAVKVSKGDVKYRVHIKDGSWLPYVTGYNTSDDINGYAGDKKPIDAIEVYYSTPNDVVSKSGYLKAKYRVSQKNADYYPYQYDDEKDSSQDGYAGVYGKTIDRFQIILSQ